MRYPRFLTIKHSPQLFQCRATTRPWLAFRHCLTTVPVATLFFSSDSMSTIANVVSTMDVIDNILESRGERELQLAVVHAVSLGRNTLQWYYVKTGLSDVYALALILHPSSKLEYFRANDFDAAWISAVEIKLRREFNVYRQRLAIKEVEPTPATTVAPQLDDNIINFSTFQNLSTVDEETRDEVSDYLAAPRVRTEDPMNWWWNHRREYPVLSQVALDYLSVPSTSVAVERVFSHGRRLLEFTRNRMSGASFRRQLCLGSWGRNNLIRIQDLIAACTPKKRKHVELEEEDDIIEISD
ncbi:putative AC9 transposase [Mycena venus]|uniref:Putative AC9 transposase n=1 Tax=Mycena venus TaxID=2733690 RepID=A0A8H6YJU3_9AGAR|nr:putative AC9 transposase [Mycena venus]